MGRQPMVLIARLDDGRTLYAVEREGRGLYVLLQLGSWANIQQLRAAAVVSRAQFLPRRLEKTIEDNLPVPLVTAEGNKYSKKKRLAIEAIQSMLKRPSLGTESQPTPLEPQTPSPQIQEQTLNEDVSVQLTATEIFENTRNQYLEALYSKAWLMLPLCPI